MCVCVCVCVYYRAIDLMSRAFANSPGKPGFNPRSSHTKDLKMLLDAASTYIYIYIYKFENFFVLVQMRENIFK